MVRLGVGPVSGKVGGHGVNLAFDPLQPDFNPVQPVFYTVNLFTQHLMPLDDDIQLVLKILCHYTHMMLDIFLYSINMTSEQLIDFFQIICIHKNLRQTFLIVQNEKSRPISSKLTRAASDLPLNTFPILVKTNGGQALNAPWN